MNVKYFLLFSFFLFAFVACEKDPCEGILCQNDGYCTGGECVCPERYTGEDCSEEIPPSKIVTNSLTVTRFPATKTDGSSWDPDNGPDIFTAIYDEDGNELWTARSIYLDADDSQYYIFQIEPALEFDDPDQTYIIRLFDFETSPPDELIGEISFTPYMANEGFPLSINVDNGEDLTFLLTVEYF